MATRSPSRLYLVGAALLALIAPLALVMSVQAPADAGSLRNHDVKIYKKEMFVSVEGEFPDNVVQPDLSCEPGDWATDGMWRIDSVDDVWDDGDFHPGSPLDVHVLWSYPDDNRNTWHFKFENTNWGRAQLHVWVTCIDDRVENQAWHDHGIEKTAVVKHAPGPQVAPFEYVWAGTQCPAGSLPSTPGFKFESGHGHLLRSMPVLATRQWKWAFSTNSATVRFYLSCLKLKVTTGNAHSHVLQHKYGTRTGHVPVTDRWVEQYDCPGSYKALWHWFDIADWDNVWFLGMDPRIKSRAYTFMRTPGAVSDEVTVGAVCISIKTGKQIAP